jgi:hypothetical protein
VFIPGIKGPKRWQTLPFGNLNKKSIEDRRKTLETYIKVCLLIVLPLQCVVIKQDRSKTLEIYIKVCLLIVLPLQCVVTKQDRSKTLETYIKVCSLIVLPLQDNTL